MDRRGIRRALVAAGGAAVLALVTSACQVDLGTLGGRASAGYGINDAGSVAGESQTLHLGSSAFAFVSDGGTDELAPIHGSDELSSRAQDVSNRGDVVGRLTWVDSPLWAWARPAGQGIRRLYTPPGSLDAEALAVNDHGIAVGYITLVVNGLRVTHAARWDLDVTGEASLRDLNGDRHENARALAVNNAGQVVGWSSQGAFLWDPARPGLQFLPRGGGGDDAGAGINDTGDIVGWVTTPQSGGSRRMAHWKTTGAHDLTVLPGYGEVEAQLNAVNDDRVAVGGSRRAGGHLPHAVRVRLGHDEVTDLAPDSEVSDARAINAAGTVAGEVLMPGGNLHASYWTAD